MLNYKFNELDTVNIIDPEILMERGSSRPQAENQGLWALALQVPGPHAGPAASLTPAFLPFTRAFSSASGKKVGFETRGKIKGFENVGMTQGLPVYSGVITAT